MISNLESIEPLLEKMNTNNQLSVIGKSVLENQFINIKLRRENKKYCFGPRCMEMKVPLQKAYLIF
jgi:hypothetical protein